MGSFSGIVYTAGLFEGEGTVSYSDGRGNRALIAAIQMTDLEPLRLAQLSVGLGRINGPYQYAETHKPHWRWFVSGPRVVDLYLLIGGWLGPRRRSQFQKSIVAWQNRTFPRRVYVRPTSPDCGRASRAGYAAHRSRGEPSCGPCRQALRDYEAKRRRLVALERRLMQEAAIAA